MANSVSYLSKAKKEFDEAINFYENRSIGLGVRFEKQVQEKIKLVSEYPKRYRNKKTTYRETKVTDFPFLIIYKYYETRQLIIINTIFHTSRNPKNKYRQ
jgi:plasmid stabilization system protein ParE